MMKSIIKKIISMLLIALIISGCGNSHQGNQKLSLANSNIMDSDDQDIISHNVPYHPIMEQNYISLKRGLNDANRDWDLNRDIVVSYDGIECKRITLRKDSALGYVNEIYDGSVLIYGLAGVTADEYQSYNFVADLLDLESNYIKIGYFSNNSWSSGPYFTSNGFIVTRRDGYVGDLNVITRIDKDSGDIYVDDRQGDILILDRKGDESRLQLQFDYGKKLPYIQVSSMVERGREYFASYLAYDPNSKRYFLTYGKSAMLADEISFDNSRCEMGIAVFDENGKQMDRFDLPGIIGGQVKPIMGPPIIAPAHLIIYYNSLDPNKVLLLNVLDSSYYLVNLNDRNYNKIDHEYATEYLKAEDIIYTSPLKIEYLENSSKIFSNNTELLMTLEGKYKLLYYQKDPATGIYYYFFSNQ